MIMHAAGLVRRALRGGTVRSLLVVMGIATGALLILVLIATSRSVTVGVTAYVGQPEIDAWVAPRGTNNLVRSSAVMPAKVADEIRDIDGVRDAAPLLRGFVTAANPDASLPAVTLLVMGYRAPGGLGGPLRLARGRHVSSAGEVVIDRAAAYRLHVDVGDALTLNGRAMNVVGVSANTNLMATQFAFVDATDAERLGGLVDRASFVAVRLHPGADGGAVRRAIEHRFVGVDVYDRETFVANNVAEVGAGFRPMQILVSAIGLTAAAMLVALLVQGTVDDRKRDIAVLFALGASTSSIARAVVSRTIVLVVMGTMFGAIGARGLGAAVDAWLPTVPMAMRLSDVLFATVMIAAAALMACAVPLFRLRRIDPVEAFRP
jgi:ABC-type antimicrobial peptide transport system permease subunit